MLRIVLSGLVMLLASTLIGCQLGDHAVTTTSTSFALGDSTVDVVVHQSAVPGLTYLNLHDNEQTAVEAALSVLRREGGRLVELQHTGERNLTFALDDSLYVFDPNRMFTDAGLRASLDTLSTATDTAHAVVRAFADSVLAIYRPDTLAAVVTVHNNTQNRYSVLSYADGGDYEDDALFVYVSGDDDPDDFFFVTDEALYNALREEGFSAVLQDNRQATDDGSLSVYCGQRGLPYVNAEAQHGHFAEQVKMLRFLHELLFAPAPAV
jgi:hypothetical protein